MPQGDVFLEHFAPRTAEKSNDSQRRWLKLLLERSFYGDNSDIPNKKTAQNWRTHKENEKKKEENEGPLPSKPRNGKIPKTKKKKKEWRIKKITK